MAKVASVAMERSWLPAVIIGGGAIVLVGAFVLLGGGASSSTADAGGLPTTAPTPIADGAPVVTFDATLPPVATAAPSTNPKSTSDSGPSPAAATEPAPIVEGPAASIRVRIAQLTREIAQLESEGKHEEAAQKRQLLARLQAKLDLVQNGP